MKLVAEFRIEALVRLGDGFRVRGVLRLERPASSIIACAEVYGLSRSRESGLGRPQVGEGMRHTAWHECERAGIDAVTCVAKNELHGALGHKPLLDVASVDMRRRSRPAGGGLLS
jgi:hypothetical protein